MRARAAISFARDGSILTDPWSQPTVIIAGIAAVISVLSAGAAWWAVYLSYRTHKRNRQNEQPSLSCRIDLGPEPPWLDAGLTLENPTLTEWTVVSARLVRPTGGRVVGHWDVMESDNYGSWNLSKEKLNAVSGNSARLDLRIGSAGSPGSSLHGTMRGDRGHTRIYLDPTDAKNGKLILEVTAVSSDAKPREHNYRVLRNLELLPKHPRA